MSSGYTDLFNKEAVLKMFDQMCTEYYEVWYGKEKKFDSIDHSDSLDNAKQFLQMQLDAIEYFGNPGQFKICFYRDVSDKGKLIAENLKGSNTFKLSENGENKPGMYWQQRNQLAGVSGNSDLAEIKQMLIAQQSQINALMENPDEPNDTEEQKAVGGVMGMLAGILNNPQVQEAIAAKAIGFLNNLIPDPSGRTMTMQPRAQLGNVTQDDITALNIAVTKLIEQGVTVADFQKLANLTADRAKFDMLLTMLRTM